MSIAKTVFPILVVLATTIVAWGQSAGERTLLIYFDSDRAELNDPAVEQLNALYAELAASAGYAIELAGHTDSRGSVAYNYALSERRVHAVQAYLLQLGVPDSLIAAAAHSELQPAADNQRPEGRRANRRVLVRCRIEERPAPAEAPAVEEIVVQQKEPEPEIPEEPKYVVLYGKQGTQVFIPTDAFGELGLEDVRFELTEALTLEEMLMLGLPTVSSNGECLETAGMVFLQITGLNNEPLTVDPEKPIRIRIPTDDFAEDFEIYDANGEHTRVTDWIPSRTQPRRVTDDDGRNFYELSVTGTSSVNIDRPSGMLAEKTNEPRPFFVARGFRRPEVKAFLSSDRSVFRHEFYRKRRFHFTGFECLPSDLRTLTVFANRQGRAFVFHAPLAEARRREGRIFGNGPRYVVRKKDFMEVYSEEETRQILAQRPEVLSWRER